MKTFFCSFFTFFAAVSFTVFAANPKFDRNDLSSVREYAGKGDPEAQYYLGLHYETENNMAEAVEWYRKAAEKDDLDAQYKLGVCYEQGKGVPQDDKKAVEWYRKAAENGIVEAQFALGLCYEKGKGIEKNLPEAVRWYRMAADRKNPEAQYRLGYCFETCKEVRNVDKAAIWYRKAAENGHAEAQFKIAQFYETGRSVERIMNEAISWYTKAARQGNLNAQIRLGRYYYENGLNGSSPDMEAGIRWYTEAAEHGYQDADLFCRIGSCYEEGKYVEWNMMEAFNWYRKAAELGSKEAKAKLEELQRLDADGVEWYRKAEATRKAQAAELGSKEAKAKLEELQRLDAEAARKTTEELMDKTTVKRSGRKTTITFPNGLKLDMIRVEAGSFMMSVSDKESFSNEVPHRATLTRAFYLGQTEVTQAQWRAVMGTDPSNFKGDDLPVEKVSWNDAMSFCEKLNSTGKAPSGWRFTLPTVTQWEYAARGGEKSRGYKYSGGNNADEVAWNQNNSAGKTHPVGWKKANELDLYDMSGNVYEWCLDDWVEDASKLKAEFGRGNDSGGLPRADRGGSWFSHVLSCRPVFRGRIGAETRMHDIGFRVALVPKFDRQAVGSPDPKRSGAGEMSY